MNRTALPRRFVREASQNRTSHQRVEYQVATDAEKKNFFGNVIPFVNTIFSHFGKAAEKATFLVDAAIVDIIIANMFFNPKDHGGVTQQRALSLFGKPLDEVEQGKCESVLILSPFYPRAHFESGIGYSSSCSNLTFTV